MARLQDLVVDCHHPAGLARFWASALEGYEIARYDAAELSRLRAAGIDDPEDDPTVLVESDGVGPRLWFQKVPEEKVVKNRVHVDLVSDNVEHEIERLVAAGATIQPDQPNESLVVLRDPEGNEFCLLR